MLLLIAWMALAGLLGGVASGGIAHADSGTRRPPGPHIAAEPLTVVEAGSARLLGSATAIGGRHVLTNRHVIEVSRRRGADVALSWAGRIIAARIAAVSDRFDLAVLVAAEALGDTPALGQRPYVGAAVAARDPGGARVEGRVVAHPWREAWGPALFVRLPARFGFSGGPLLDASGGVVGLVTAAVNPTADEIVALRAHGGMRDRDMPVVLVLPIAPALAEAERLLAQIR
jgi:S1-C subfamily serine protease